VLAALSQRLISERASRRPVKIMAAMTPFDEMNRMMNDMEEWMAGMRRSMGDRRGFGGRSGPVTVDSDGEGFVVYADLPGFEKSEIDLRIDGRVLAIDASHESGDGPSARSRRVSERVTLPEADIVAEEVTASYRNGVLEVHVPTVDAEGHESGHSIRIE
jgi:HSP20 family protein